MSTTDFINNLALLSPEDRQMVEQLVHRLKEATLSPVQTLPKRQFGAMKGFFTMSDDFNEPLDDFNDYQ